MTTLNAILAGAIAMGSLVACLFFLRFWKSTQDRFFLYFAMSFALEFGSQLVLGMTSLHNEESPVYYLIRLVAYSLILLAIFEKNSRRNKQ